jgi:hypothetical protein
MTDHIPNDLSHLSEEEFNALCPQGEHAPGPEPLSPAAQAVLWAGLNRDSDRLVIAAALRAAADQVDAVNVPCHIRGDAYWSYRDGRAAAKVHLIAIADELAGHA